MNLFSYNSPVMRFLERVFDLVVLNLLTLVLCIPIVTAGAAMTALFKTLFDIRQQKGRTLITFWQTFRAEFRPALPLGLLAFVAIAAYGGYLYLLYAQLAEEAAWAWITVAAIGALFFFPMTFVFPLFAKFQNTIKKTIVNAFYMSIRHLPVTLLMLAMQAVWVFAIFLFPYQAAFLVLAWFFFGISLPAYLGSGLFLKVFAHYAEME
ncbi:MAG TPA: hypothetical protein DCY10_08090 [Clostridiales bacterium]|nr:hypothetical protein [Clostridiales bacterium]